MPAATSALARDEALARGITINGLVILSDTPVAVEPRAHQSARRPGAITIANNVVGGPGAFVLEAKDFNSFGQAIIKKLIAEIADATPAR